MAGRRITIPLWLDPTGVKKGAQEASSALGKFGQSIATGIGIGVGLKALDAFTNALRSVPRLMDEMVERGGQVATIQSGFVKSVADSANVLNQTRAATKGLIDDFTIMQRANQASALGLDTTAESFAKLAKTATVLGQAMGVDAVAAFDRLVLGIGKGEPELLDELGLVLRAEEAYRGYADAHGLVATKLTTTQKQQALVTEALRQADEITSRLGDVQLTLSQRIGLAGIAFKNLTDQISLGVATAPGLNAALAEIGATLHESFTEGSGAAETTREIVDDVAQAVIYMAQAFVEGARIATRAWTGVELLMRGFVGLIFEVVNANIQAFAAMAKAGASAFEMVGLDDMAASARRGAEGFSGFGSALANEGRAGITGALDAQAGREAALDKASGALTRLSVISREASKNAVELGKSLGDAGAAGGAAELAGSISKGLNEALKDFGKLADQMLDEDINKIFMFDEDARVSRGVPGTFGARDLALAHFEMGSGISGGVPGDNSNLFPELRAKGVNLGAVFEGLTHVVSASLGRFEQVPQIVDNMARAFKEGGDKFTAVAGAIAQIGGLIGGKAGGLIQGAAGGAMAGAQFGPWGAVAGGLLGGAMSLFGPGEEETVNDQRDEFFSQWENGFVGLQEQLQGLTNQDLVAKIFDADTVQEFKAAVSEVQGLLDTQKAAQEALTEAAGRYNFTIAEMGPLFRQQELDAMAGQLISDWQLLNQAGFDQNAIIRELGPGMQEYIDAALQAGSAIPEAMREPIEKMIELGQLTDEEGNPFTDLEDSGIEFTKTLSEGLGDLIEKLDEFIMALSGEIPAVEIPVRYGAPSNRPGSSNDNRPPGDYYPSPDQAFPGGGIVKPRADGWRTADGHVPIMALPGETVLPRGGGGTSVSFPNMVVNLSGGGADQDAQKFLDRVSETLEQGQHPRFAAAVAGAR